MLKLYVEYLGLKTKAVDAIRHLRGEESGATAIEYGLIAALIAVVIIGVLATIGTNLNSKLNSVASKM